MRPVDLSHHSQVGDCRRGAAGCDLADHHRQAARDHRFGQGDPERLSKSLGAAVCILDQIDVETLFRAATEEQGEATRAGRCREDLRAARVARKNPEASDGKSRAGACGEKLSSALVSVRSPHGSRVVVVDGGRRREAAHITRGPGRTGGRVKVKATQGFASRHLRVAPTGFDSGRRGRWQGRRLGLELPGGEIPGPTKQLRGNTIAAVQAAGGLEFLDGFLGHDNLLRSLAVDVVRASLVPPDDILRRKFRDPDLLALGAFAQDGHAYFHNAVTRHGDMADCRLAAPFPGRLGRKTCHELAAIADLDGAGGIAGCLPSKSRAGDRERE